MTAWNKNISFVKHYKPNCTYKLLIHGVYPYVGCHCKKQPYIRERELLLGSGNYLALQINKNITRQEYLDCVELLWVKEFDTKEEALENEIQEIQKCKEEYGDLCKNKTTGNKYGAKGYKKSKESIERHRQYLIEYYKTHESSFKDCHHTDEAKKRMSEAKKGPNNYFYGKHLSEEHKRKLSVAKMGNKGAAGFRWFNNGVITTYAKECPEGFVPGRIGWSKKS